MIGPGAGSLKRPASAAPPMPPAKQQQQSAGTPKKTYTTGTLLALSIYICVSVCVCNVRGCQVVHPPYPLRNHAPPMPHAQKQQSVGTPKKTCTTGVRVRVVQRSIHEPRHPTGHACSIACICTSARTLGWWHSSSLCLLCRVPAGGGMFSQPPQGLMQGFRPGELFVFWGGSGERRARERGGGGGGADTVGALGVLGAHTCGCFGSGRGSKPYCASPPPLPSLPY